MVFLSTMQALMFNGVGRFFLKAGTRALTAQMIWENVAMGLFFVLPLSIFLGHTVVRLGAGQVLGKPSFIGSEIWTTITIVIAGDLVFEVLLPSLQCPPFSLDHSIGMGGRENIPESWWLWFAQSWGFCCPASLRPSSLLTSKAGGGLLALRLAFVALGVYLGESFRPVALTGGIATGKSTVARMLAASSSSTTSSILTPTMGSKRTRKHGKGSTSSGAESDILDTGGYHSDGYFTIIDADALAHEILLPPVLLAQEQDSYSVQPHESVYDEVVEAFGENVLIDGGNAIRHIDRTKLGQRIFADTNLRKQLNQITHSRILKLLIKRLLWAGLCPCVGGSVVCADVPLLFESRYLRHLFVLTIVVVCTPEQQWERLKERQPDWSDDHCRARLHAQMPLEAKRKLAHVVLNNTGNRTTDLILELKEMRLQVIRRLFGMGISLFHLLLLVGALLCLAVATNCFGLL